MNKRLLNYLILWFLVLFNFSRVVFHSIGISYGGDCRPVRLWSLVATGLVGIVIALFILLKRREEKRFDELFAFLEQRSKP